MLVDFSFENFLSFRDEASISLVAADGVHVSDGKGPDGASHLYSLVEFAAHPEDKGGDMRTDYLRGIYGAIPYFGDLKRFEEEYCGR